MTQQQMGEHGDATWVEHEELPRRPRRHWITPLTGALLAVLLAACGFLAGVLVEKGQGGSTTATGAGLSRRAGTGAGAGAAGAAAGVGQGARGGLGNATIGQVSSLQGRSLYVTTTDGSTVQVNVPPGEKVSRTTSAGVRDIHPGDTVVIQGSQSGDGAITASSVRATAADVGGGFGGLFGGGGGAGGAGGGSGQGGRNGNLNQLFQPPGG